MGYHIVLLRSPRRPVTWAELAAAARQLGWEACDASREVRRTEGGVLAARVILGRDGEPWCKLTGEAELAQVIALGDALGARARGDEFESYRSVDDSYIHPDDRPALDAATAEARAMRARNRGFTVWNGVRLAVLIALAGFFLLRVVNG